MSEINDLLQKLKQDPESVSTSELINQSIILQLEKITENNSSTVNGDEVIMSNLIKLLELRG